MVTIKVGPEQTPFCMHKAIVCSQSTYFEKAFNGRLEEATTGVITLADIDVDLFRIISAWLYTGMLQQEATGGPIGCQTFSTLEFGRQSEPTTPDRTLSVSNLAEQTESGSESSSWSSTDNSTQTEYRTIDQTSAALNLSDQTDSEYDKPETWEWEMLVDLYILADRLVIIKLRYALIDAMITKCSTSCPAPYIIRRVYDQTPTSSSLRDLVTDIWAYSSHIDFSGEDVQHLPTEFWVPLVKRISSRLPRRLCPSCREEASNCIKDIPHLTHELSLIHI